MVDDDGKATASNCAAPNPTFNTIQAAVIAADPGDIVKVCPGTYTENVTVNKALSLRGAKAGVDARTRAATNESVVHPANPSLPLLATGTATTTSYAYVHAGHLLTETLPDPDAGGPLTSPVIGHAWNWVDTRRQLSTLQPAPTSERLSLTAAPMSRASVGRGRCVLRAPGGPVDLDRYPLRGGSRVDQVKRGVRAGVGE